MSTKQILIFIAMLIFLCGMLTTLGMWIHYSVEIDVKTRARKAIQEETGRVKLDKERLEDVLKQPETGLQAQLNAENARVATQEAKVYTDPTGAFKKLYDEKKPELETEWNSAKTDWEVVYDEWKKRNQKIVGALKQLEDTKAETVKRLDSQHSELSDQLKVEEADKRKHVETRRQWSQELSGIRSQSEETVDKISQVTRDLEKTADTRPDGRVIFSDPSLHTVTVDLGSEQGARTGLKFTIYSAAHQDLVKKGEIVLTQVRATSSDAVVLSSDAKGLIDPTTGWQAPDPRMRYSIYNAANTADATTTQQLQKQKTKLDLVEEVRLQRVRQEQGLDAADQAAQESAAASAPPPNLGIGFVPIVEGDWISNPEFVRVTPRREFQQALAGELAGMGDVNIGTQTFYFTDMIRPFRKEFLGRLCERNHCKVTDHMSAEVDCIVSVGGATNPDSLLETIRSSQGKDEVTPDVQNRRRTLEALKEGKKFGCRVITEDDLEPYFQHRQRKADLVKGQATQPGQSVFYVLGETKLRSVRETGLYIQEHGGILAPELGSEVDYVVVGEGLENAKYDRKSKRIYYQNAPDKSLPFYGGQESAIKAMGWQILREEELAHFFGLK